MKSRLCASFPTRFASSSVHPLFNGEEGSEIARDFSEREEVVLVVRSGNAAPLRRADPPEIVTFEQRAVCGFREASIGGKTPVRWD